MNIDEKANEISAKYSVGTIPTETECISYQAAKEGMEWMMEKTCKWLEGIAESTGYDSYDVIESYKKAMKEE